MADLPTQQSSTTSNRDFSFYDDLRRSTTATFRPVREPKPSVGRALHIASDPERLGGIGTDVTLCHVPIFLRYSMYDEEAEEFRDVSWLSYGGTAGALLAMHHFNDGDGSIVEELGGINERCKIRFTTEVIDTQSSSIAAVQQLASDITHRPKTDVVRPPACAVMGAAWYTVSQSMATVTGVYDLLQVSPSSSSMSLDSSTNYPLFSRTHPSDEAKGRLAVEYFDRHLDIKHIGILFVNNEQGLSLQKTVLDAATERNMTVRSVSFPDDASAASLRNSLVQLKETGFSYFLGVFFPLPYDYVMEMAVDVGVAGPGKFWLATGHLADAYASANTTVSTGSVAAIGSTGLGILHDDLGLEERALPGLPQHEKFLRQWKNIQHDQEMLDYMNSKQPAPPEGSSMVFQRSGDYFQGPPSHYSQFSYDAIAGMGIAACQAASLSTHPDNYFTGKEHHKAFTNHPFVGATGNVSFAHDSFSRDGYTVYNFVSEIQEIDRPTNRTSTLSGKTSVYFDTKLRKWKQWPGARKFVYSDGLTSPPLELPPYSENTNGLNSAVVAVCQLLAAVVMLSSIGLSIFVFVKRKRQIITASQPPFLYMLCVGTLVMSSAIIPATIDDSIASATGCSIACMSQVWLASIGFTITFSALFSKTQRINMLVKMAQSFGRFKLTAADVIAPFLFLFSINVLILSLWTASAPLQWYRKPLHYDRFGRQVASVGVCHNDDWMPYGVALFCVNGAVLFLAILEAYKARNVSTEFSESKHIAAAVVCIFQALFFGVPLFFLTREWPTAQIFVLTAVIFTICMAVLLLIFVPKIRLLRKDSHPRTLPTLSTGRLSTVPGTVRHPGGTLLPSSITELRRSASTALVEENHHRSSITDLRRSVTSLAEENQRRSSITELRRAVTLLAEDNHRRSSITDTRVSFSGLTEDTHRRSSLKERRELALPQLVEQKSSEGECSEKDAQNASDLDEVQSLQQELGRATEQIETLRQEIEALKSQSDEKQSSPANLVVNEPPHIQVARGA